MDQPKKHQKQEILQIWLPLITAILFCVALLVLSITLTTGNPAAVGTLSDIALILIILPLFLVFLSVLFLVIILVKVILNLNQKLPPIFFKGQQLSGMIERKVNSSAMQATVPVIKLLSTKAALYRFLSFAPKRRK